MMQPSFCGTNPFLTGKKTEVEVFLGIRKLLLLSLLLIAFLISSHVNLMLICSPVFKKTQ